MEFLRYPHLIRYHFNGSRFGPPWSFTSTSTWTWVGHPVSGRIQLTSYALFRLGLPAPPALNALSLPVTITRRTILQKVPHHRPFQRTCVRPSMEFYLHFSLDMDRSLGFGSIAYDSFALFRLALASAPCLKHLTLPHTITRRTILQKVPDHTLTCSRCL